MDGIASAVVLPDQDPSPLPSAQSPTGTKRRQSSVSEQGAKRARLNDDDDSTQRRDSVSKAAPTAPASAPKGRERGRERRLFGAVLGALSQNPAPAGQKKRLEIEKRQQARRKLEDEESEQRRTERLAKLKEERWKQQESLDRYAMQLRHDNLLAMAHSLKTKSEPQLYYKPWELTADEKNRIRDQIADAKETIEQEVEQYRRDQDAQRSQTTSREGAIGHIDSTKQVSHPGKGMTMDVEARPVTTNGSPTDGSVPLPTQSKQQPASLDSHSGNTVSETPAHAGNRQSEPTSHQYSTETSNREAIDETGEEVVEAAEDTVIY